MNFFKKQTGTVKCRAHFFLFSIRYFSKFAVFKISYTGRVSKRPLDGRRESIVLKEGIVREKLKNAGRILVSYLQKTLFSDFISFCKWLLIALGAGGMIGLAGTGFHMAIGWAEGFREEQTWLFWLLPVGGLFIALLYRWCGMEADPGTDMVLFSVRSEAKISWKTAPLIFISTVITHLLGGSAGREGAALQLGGSGCF